ncbi:MAG: hypothetical protein ACK4PR_03490 [Gammaproteobacteria bacterium]
MATEQTSEYSFSGNFPVNSDDKIIEIRERPTSDNLLIDSFKNNSFDLPKINNQRCLALRDPEGRGEIITVPYKQLIKWHEDLSTQQKSEFPAAYQTYFDTQALLSDTPDISFKKLMELRQTEDKKAPSLRRLAQEKIPVPYSKVKPFSEAADNKHEVSNTLFARLQQYNLKFTCTAVADGTRHILLTPNEKDGIAYFISHAEFKQWYSALLEDEKNKISPLYSGYFSATAPTSSADPKEYYTTDSTFEGLAARHDAQHITTTTVEANNLNASPSSSFHGAAAQSNNIPVYQPSSFSTEKINELATAEGWTVSDQPMMGLANQTYVEIKLTSDPATKVHQYKDRIVIPGAITPSNADMAAKIAATSSDVITVRNDINDKASLAETFLAILKEGKLPIVRASTDTTTTITQAEIFQYLDEKNPGPPKPSEKLQTNLDSAPEKAKTFYNRACPAAPAPAPSPSAGP